MPRFVRMLPATLALAALTFAAPTPMFAVNKDMVQLQTQMQQLLDQVARLQQSNDERMGVQRDLIQQTIDSVNRMSQLMDAMQRQVRAQSDASSKGVEQVSGQMQSLNDSVDELKARLGRIEKSLGDLQSSQQSINARIDTPAAGTGASALPSSDAPSATAPAARGGRTSAAPASGGMAAAPAAPPVEDLYRTAFGDYNGAKYTVAAAEFNDVIKYYPDANYAGNAYFYLGEIEYKAGRYAAASKFYDKVGEQYPGNPKIPVAQLRKGESLIALKQNDAGVRELRSLIQRYPNSQEASAARSKLNGMGVTITPRTR
ncbi:MAG: tetratricopeptide repeat protein [Janthinobacterium lividum]